ncbi:MAG: alcohol dehydrogenase catalytic domain-containing protein, partial [Chloroflexi bacterium]|nr:alcohol dehydrogenase catalytic domain-containing protein [Chloroflexota bacterium]
MRQSVWTPAGIILRDIEPPPLQDGWVRLKVAACGICGSDLHRYRHPGDGGTPGHELVGTVLNASTPMPDVLYAVEPWLACGTCDYCLAGQRQHCRSGRLLGATVPGGLADFVDAPAAEVHRLPADVPPLLASMTEPLAVATRAVHRARLLRDSRVLVIGAGAIGLLVGLLARDATGRVAIVTRHEHQAALARKLRLEPATEAEAELFAKDFQPDVVFESVGGEAKTVEQAMQAVRPSGRVVVLGLFSAASQLDTRALIMKELELTGSKVYGLGAHGHEFVAAVALVPRYATELAALQTHQFGLSDIPAAFACAADKSTKAVKVT